MTSVASLQQLALLQQQMSLMAASLETKLVGFGRKLEKLNYGPESKIRDKLEVLGTRLDALENRLEDKVLSVHDDIESLKDNISNKIETRVVDKLCQLEAKLADASTAWTGVGAETWMKVGERLLQMRDQQERYTMLFASLISNTTSEMAARTQEHVAEILSKGYTSNYLNYDNLTAEVHEILNTSADLRLQVQNEISSLAKNLEFDFENPLQGIDIDRAGNLSDGPDPSSTIVPSAENASTSKTPDPSSTIVPSAKNARTSKTPGPSSTISSEAENPRTSKTPDPSSTIGPAAGNARTSKTPDPPSESPATATACRRGLRPAMFDTSAPYAVIAPNGESGLDVPYLCDMVTEGGGWVVIQRRINGDVDFYRDWDSYKKGFGNLDGDFWLGNANTHALTSDGSWELRVSLKYRGNSTFALYDSFSLDEEKTGYTLRLGRYSGTAGDDLSYHKGRAFSTFDRDSDGLSKFNCAADYSGGWWYVGCYKSNLNGKWPTSGSTTSGMEWVSLTGYFNPVSESEMKIRKIS